MADTRVLPVASVRLFDEAEGDPVVTDHGFAWYDILAQSYQFGTSTRNASGFPLLEFLPEIGVTCRPFLQAYHTRLSQYATNGGSWSESRDEEGVPRVYRLYQADNSAGLRYAATSRFSLPQNPSVAFVLRLPDSHGDWDADTQPPYVQVEFGSGQWAVFIDPQSSRLLRKVAGVWTAAADLQRPESGGYEDQENEYRLWVRCLRGKVGVSTDNGRNYVWAENPDQSPITVPGSPFTLRGQGGDVGFALWQLRYYVGTYTSAPRDTLTRRISALPTFSSRANLPPGTSLTFSDLSTPTAGLARYAVTLTPKSTPGVPFAFWAAPELYATAFRYPAVVVPGEGTYTTPWDRGLVSFTVEEPYELGEGSTEIMVRQAATVPLTGSYRWRKLEVWAGSTQQNGETELSLVSTGYVREIHPERVGFGQTELRIKADSAAGWLRQAKWSPQDVFPLGGLTVNQASDYILASEGLNASYRLWNTLGDLYTLPLGTPEDPFELIRPGESKWDTLVRIHGYMGLEVGVLRDGTFTAVPQQYVSITEHSYTATEGDLTNTLAKVSNPVNYQESATLIVVSGKDQTGATLTAWAVDSAAEGSVLSGRFSPRRQLRQEELNGTCDLGVLTMRTQAKAYDAFQIKYEPGVEFPVNLDVSRRDRLVLHGAAEVGIPDGAAHAVLSLTHTYQAGLGFAELRSVAGLRRI